MKKPGCCIAPVLLAGLLAGCTGGDHFLTAKVHDSPDHIVRLQAIPDANGGKGYSHPAYLSKEQMARVLRGLHVEKNTSLVPAVFQRGGGKPQTIRAFSDAEVRFFAPHLVKGLAMATPEEIVTFYGTAELSSTQHVVTSGGMLIRGDELHVVLSNYRVKLDTWQDNELYESPFHLRPLHPIHPEPGRLSFEPPQYMIAPAPKTGLSTVVRGQRLHVAIRFHELSQIPAGESSIKAPLGK